MSENKLGLDTLESWLWDSANILRGSIDSSDFKNYIFGLLFLKRSNDVFEEEVENIMERDGISREDAEDETYFFVPEEARWSTIKKETENIGIALDKAFAAIERENTSLEGVMTATKFGDKEKLSDDVLQRLLRHFNTHSLRNDHLESNDLLGDAYEYLIKQFADDAGKKGGEFYSPRGVVQLIVQIIKPQPKHKVYDPTCGSGGMLIESAKYVAEQPNGKVGSNINVSLFGQEKNLSTWAIGKMNMILHNFMDADIQKGDTLTDPKHRNEQNELDLFDRVIANPPFSMDKWWQKAEVNLEKKLDKNGKEKEIAPNYSKVVSDPYGRFQYGVPPRKYADFAFLQHITSVLKENGIAGVVLPLGSLSRASTEAKIREKIIDSDIVEAIIALPKALFYNTPIQASVWIINKNKAHEKKGKILLIEASDEFKEGKNQNELLPKHISKILSAYEGELKDEKFSKWVTIDDIKRLKYDLNILKYIDKSEPEKVIDIEDVKSQLKRIEDNMSKLKESELTHIFNTQFTPIANFGKTDLPDNWKVYKLKDVADFRRGSFPQPYGLDKWYDDENGFPFVQVYDVAANKKLKKTTKRRISMEAAEQSVFVEKGSLILTIQGTIGRIAITNYDAYVDRTLLIFQHFKLEVDKYYFMYVIDRLFEFEKQKAHGSTIKTITKEQLSNFEIPVPPIEEQRSIAKRFKTLDDYIDFSNEKSRLLNQIKIGFMQRALTGALIPETHDHE